MSVLSIVSMHTATDTDPVVGAIMRFCSIGWLASFCLMSLGVDLTATWV
jgi:hypothetical protein